MVVRQFEGEFDDSFGKGGRTVIKVKNLIGLLALSFCPGLVSSLPFEFRCFAQRLRSRTSSSGVEAGEAADGPAGGAEAPMAKMARLEWLEMRPSPSTNGVGTPPRRDSHPCPAMTLVGSMGVRFRE